MAERINDSNTSNKLFAPSVKVTYTIHGNVTKSQTFESLPPARIGLPEGVEATKPSAGEYVYSGMHDHGPLPAPKEGGPMAELIACVQAAKATNDEYLTAVIEQENEEKEIETNVEIKDPEEER